MTCCSVTAIDPSRSIASLDGKAPDNYHHLLHSPPHLHHYNNSNNNKNKKVRGRSTAPLSETATRTRSNRRHHHHRPIRRRDGCHQCATRTRNISLTSKRTSCQRYIPDPEPNLHQSEYNYAARRTTNDQLLQSHDRSVNHWLILKQFHKQCSKDQHRIDTQQSDQRYNTDIEEAKDPIFTDNGSQIVHNNSEGCYLTFEKDFSSHTRKHLNQVARNVHSVNFQPLGENSNSSSDPNSKISVLLHQSVPDLSADKSNSVLDTCRSASFVGFLPRKLDFTNNSILSPEEGSQIREMRAQTKALFTETENSVAPQSVPHLLGYPDTRMHQHTAQQQNVISNSYTKVKPAISQPSRLSSSSLSTPPPPQASAPTMCSSSSPPASFTTATSQSLPLSSSSFSSSSFSSFSLPSLSRLSSRRCQKGIKSCGEYSRTDNDIMERQRDSLSGCLASRLVESSQCLRANQPKSQPSTSCTLAARKGSTRKSYSSSRGFESYFPRVILTIAALALLISPALAGMEIMALEYYRKFDQYLNLGQCPLRDVQYDLRNGTIIHEKLGCDLHFRDGTKRSIKREINDTRNVMIKNAKAILPYIGLCGGEAASFLGILNTGDCVTVEIGSKLTFNSKTVVRAFIGYYRTSLDVMDRSGEPIDVDSYRDMGQWLKNRYFLKSVSYGALSAIFVQFRFPNAGEARKARAVKLDSDKMSDYMTAIKSRVGIPRQVTVISLSTDTQKTLQMKRFKTSRGTSVKNRSWDRAFREVQILENTIEHSRQKIASGASRPHLKYQLDSFLQDEASKYRVSDPKLWQKISMLEVELKRGLKVSRNTKKQCRSDNSQLCGRAREGYRRLKRLYVKIHQGRNRWLELSEGDKKKIYKANKPNVKSYLRFTRRSSKEVRAVRRRRKLQKLKEKENGRNQTDNTTIYKLGSGRPDGSSSIGRSTKRGNKNAQRNKNKKRKKPEPRKRIPPSNPPERLAYSITMTTSTTQTTTTSTQAAARYKKPSMPNSRNTRNPTLEFRPRTTRKTIAIVELPRVGASTSQRRPSRNNRYSRSRYHHRIRHRKGV